MKWVAIILLGYIIYWQDERIDFLSFRAAENFNIAKNGERRLAKANKERELLEHQLVFVQQHLGIKFYPNSK